jgi:hypothetical protein
MAAERRDHGLAFTELVPRDKDARAEVGELLVIGLDSVGSDLDYGAVREVEDAEAVMEIPPQSQVESEVTGAPTQQVWRRWWRSGRRRFLRNCRGRGAVKPSGRW